MPDMERDEEFEADMATILPMKSPEEVPPPEGRTARVAKNGFFARVAEDFVMRRLTPAQRFCVNNGVEYGGETYKSLVNDLFEENEKVIVDAPLDVRPGGYVGGKNDEDGGEYSEEDKDKSKDVISSEFIDFESLKAIGGNSYADVLRDIATNAWVPYAGERGGKGAKNTVTGHIVYGTWAEHVLLREAHKAGGKPEPLKPSLRLPDGVDGHSHFSAILTRAKPKDLEILLTRSDSHKQRPPDSGLSQEEWDFVVDTFGQSHVSEADRAEQQHHEEHVAEYKPMGFLGRLKERLQALKAKKAKEREERIIREAAAASAGSTFPAVTDFSHPAPPPVDDDALDQRGEEPEWEHQPRRTIRPIALNAFLDSNSIDPESSLGRAIIDDYVFAITSNAWQPWNGPNKAGKTVKGARNTETGEIIFGAFAEHVLSGHGKTEATQQETPKNGDDQQPQGMTPSEETVKSASTPEEQKGALVKKLFSKEGYALEQKPTRAITNISNKDGNTVVIVAQTEDDLKDAAAAKEKAIAPYRHYWNPATPPFDEKTGKAFRPVPGQTEEWMKAVEATPSIQKRETARQVDWIESTGRGRVLERFPDGMPKRFEYTPEHIENQRQLVRRIIADSDRIGSEHFGSGSSIAPAGEKPKMFYIMGTAGAGKSSFVTTHIMKELGGAGAINTGADIVKEYRKDDGYAGWNAQSYHPESRDVADMLKAQSMAENRNMLVERIGQNYEEAKREIEWFQKNGYEVHVRLADVPIERSMQAALERMFREERKAGPGKGRYVPMEDIYRRRNKPDGSGPRNVYDRLKTENLGVSFLRFDTDTEWVEEGGRGRWAYPAIVTDSFKPTKATEKPVEATT